MNDEVGLGSVGTGMGSGGATAAEERTAGGGSVARSAGRGEGVGVERVGGCVSKRSVMEEHGERGEAPVRIVEEDQLPYRDTSSISIHGVTGPRQVRKRVTVEANEPRAWEWGTES
jgi:hypothetical protein